MGYFGLMGHLGGMVRASNVGARISLDAVPVIPGTWDLIDDGQVPGGTHRNLESVEKHARWHPGISQEAKLLLCDAQTSGGLLISLAPERVGALLKELEARGVQGTVIGEMAQEGQPSIEVAP